MSPVGRGAPKENVDFAMVLVFVCCDVVAFEPPTLKGYADVVCARRDKYC